MDDTLNKLAELPAAEIDKILSTLAKEDPPAYQELHDILLAADSRAWIPLPGRQTEAYNSKADVLGYGGAAGGGKTALAVGLAKNEHQTAAFFRREGTQLEGIIDYIESLEGTRDGYNSQKNKWRFSDGRQYEFCSTPNPGDETKYQGRPKDLLVIDEAANFLEAQVRFVMGWVRSVDPNQRCRTLMCFNPPTTPEGAWVKKFFAPWLDDNHPNPAEPGELRWYITKNGKDVQVEDDTPIYDDTLGDYIVPLSRTFIPARVTDNPYLVRTGYMSVLQGLPEPLRSQMLYGDFTAGADGHEYQLLPTTWVNASMERWHEEKRNRRPVMDAIGVDVSRGGRDNTFLAPRYGQWFDELKEIPPDLTKDGKVLATEILKHAGRNTDIFIDGNGVGASPYDFLTSWNLPAYSLIGQASPTVSQVEGIPQLQYGNLRAQMAWELRCSLDPNNTNYRISLPPDSELLAEATGIRYRITGTKLYVESKDDIIKRLGRSTDRFDSVMYGSQDSQKGYAAEPLPDRVEVKHSRGSTTLYPGSNRAPVHGRRRGRR